MIEEASRFGFKWPVAAEKAIPASPSALWEVISTPGILEACHPFCAKNPVLIWPGAGSKDEVHYFSGWIYERHFLRWVEGVGYDLEIGRKGGQKSRVSWRITPAGDGESCLRITIYPYVLQNFPAAMRWLPHRFWLRPMLQKYLASVLAGFEWYVKRREPVPPERFGKHPWFSSS